MGDVRAYRVGDMAEIDEVHGGTVAAAPRPRMGLTLGLSFIAILVIVGIATVLRDPTAITTVMAVIYAAGAIWLSLKWRKSVPATSAPEGSLEARIVKVRAEIEWARSWLLLFPIGLWYTAILKFSAQTNHSLTSFFPMVFASARRGEGATIAMFILCGVLVYFAWRVIRARRRLRELELLAG